MKKYNCFRDVKTYTRYRLDILSGDYKGCYMYDNKHQERAFLLQIGALLENHTIIYFMEKALDVNDLTKLSMYNIVDRIEKEEA